MRAARPAAVGAAVVEPPRGGELVFVTIRSGIAEFALRFRSE
jgi:hypothetical protein